MAKLSPLQRVKKEHGSKADLAKKVIGILEPREEEDQADFEHRVQTMSNQKLLRLLEADSTLKSKHTSKEALAKQITQAKFKGHNADYAAKIATFSAPKLLDLARQHGI